MKNYIIVSNDKITLEEKVKELNNDKQSEVVYYDLTEVPVERLVEDLDTYNFFSNKKIIIGNNA